MLLFATQDNMLILSHACDHSSLVAKISDALKINNNPVRSYFPFFLLRGSLCNVIAKVLDCSLKVSKFELQSYYYVTYLWERYETTYPLMYRLNSLTAVLLQGWLWHWITHKGLYAIKKRSQSNLISCCVSLACSKTLFLCSSFIFFQLFLLAVPVWSSLCTSKLFHKQFATIFLVKQWAKQEIFLKKYQVITFFAWILNYKRIVLKNSMFDWKKKNPRRRRTNWLRKGWKNFLFGRYEDKYNMWMNEWVKHKQKYSIHIIHLKMVPSSH